MREKEDALLYYVWLEPAYQCNERQEHRGKAGILLQLLLSTASHGGVDLQKSLFSIVNTDR